MTTTELLPSTTPPGLVDRFQQWSPAPGAATAAVACASVATAGTAWFARQLTDAGMAPVSVAFARFGFTAIVLARWVRLDGARRRATGWGLASGAGMALGWITYVRAIAHGSVASVGVAYMTYPLFAMLTLVAAFGIRPMRRQVLGGGLVAIGALVALGPGGGAPWFTVAAPLTFGASIAILTERLTALDPFERLAAVALGASAALVPLVVASDAVAPRDATTWAWAICLGVGCALLPMLVYAAAAPYAGAARASVAGAVELPVIVAIGATLGEPLGRNQLLGAALICLAVVVASASRPAHAIPGEHLGSGQPSAAR